LIVERSFDFALKTISLFIELRKQKEFIISKQVLRSGTSIGANIEEAQGAQSKRDFIAKMSIALKEARETCYWIELLDKSALAEVELGTYKAEILIIIKLLTKIIKKSKETIHRAPLTIH
jgi:four helix bundle protein